MSADEKIAHRQSRSDMSVLSLRATSLDVCEYVYGDSVPSVDAISQFYEPNASKPFIRALSPQPSLTYLFFFPSVSLPTVIHNAHSPSKSYENPFLTATSRSIITDIQRMSRQFSSVDVPRPLAMFCTLFRLEIPDRARNAAPLFRALRIWTETGDISETESFGEASLFIPPHFFS